MWTTSIQFLHTPTSALSSSSSGGGGGGTNLLATGTAYKQVQIYDIRTSASSSATTGTRRPVLYTPEHLLSHRITSVCQLSDGNTLAIGDSIGDVHLLDMRKMHSGKSYTSTSNKRKSKEEISLGRLVGPGGSIKQLCIHPTLPYIACVGLDRKLWTWDVTKRKMMDCIYLKQRLNCFLFCEDESWNNENDNDDGSMIMISTEKVEWRMKRMRLRIMLTLMMIIAMMMMMMTRVVRSQREVAVAARKRLNPSLTMKKRPFPVQRDRKSR